MIVYLNGKKTDIPRHQSVEQCVVNLSDGNTNFVVEINEDIVPKDKWEEKQIQDGDRVEVIGFVGGG